MGILDLSDPKRAGAWLSLATETNDLWLEGGRVFLATEQGMEILDDLLNVKLRYKTSHATSMIRVRGDDVFLYGAGLGLQVLDISDSKVKFVSSFDPAATISDIAIEKEMLYAATSGNELLEIDTAKLSRLRIRGIYPLIGQATGIKIINGTALLAGNDIITAVQLSPPLTVTRHSKKDIRMLLPKNLPAGAYHMVEITRDGNRNISHNILNIDTLRFSKPEITPEEFQQLLQAQQKKPVRKGNTH